MDTTRGIQTGHSAGMKMLATAAGPWQRRTLSHRVAPLPSWRTSFQALQCNHAATQSADAYWLRRHLQIFCKQGTMRHYTGAATMLCDACYTLK